MLGSSVCDGVTAGERAANAAHDRLRCVDLERAKRTALLEGLDKEQHAFMKTKKGDTPTPYFRMMKELTMLGFFTSEIGMTKAMRYIETPGRWDPCVPYVKGETTWAQHA
jgi:hypothetical protein